MIQSRSGCERILLRCGDQNGRGRKIAGALVTPLGSLRNFFDTLPRSARVDQRLNMICCWSCNAITALSTVYETAAPGGEEAPAPVHYLS